MSPDDKNGDDVSPNEEDVSPNEEKEREKARKKAEKEKAKAAKKAAREKIRAAREQEREESEAIKAARQQVKLHAMMDAEEAKRLRKEADAITKRAESRRTFEEDLAKHHEYVSSLAPKMGFDPKRPVLEIQDIPKGHKELSMQPYNDGMAYVRITQDPVKNQLLYEVIEPQLSEIEQRALQFLRDTLIQTMSGRRPDDQDPGEYLDKALLEAIRDHAVLIDEVGTQRVRYHLRRDLLGFGPIDIMMEDSNLEDISCDGPGIPVYVFHREYESIRTNVVFEDEHELDAYVIRLAQQSGKHISVADPLLDATLPDGSRLQATLSKEVTSRGSSFTVRKFRAEPLTPIHLMEFGTFNSILAAYFWFVMEHGMSILLAGGTASGKTTSLNAVCQFIPPQKKVVSIEDTREINLQHENWIAGVTRTGFGTPGAGGINAGTIDMYALLGAALRQRPEYLLVGEVRGKEALTLFQAMATGHAVYSTMHADSVPSAVYRLENEPINVPRLMLQTLDVVAIQTQVRMGERMVRRLGEVTEVVGFDSETGDLLTNQVFEWDPATDEELYMGKSYILEKIATRQNRTEQDVEEEWEDRMRILEWLHRTGVKRFDKVAEVVSKYYRDPESVMRLVTRDEEKRGERPRLNIHASAEGHEVRVPILDEQEEYDPSNAQPEADPFKSLPSSSETVDAGELFQPGMESLPNAGDGAPQEPTLKDLVPQEPAPQSPPGSPDTRTEPSELPRPDEGLDFDVDVADQQSLEYDFRIGDNRVIAPRSGRKLRAWLRRWLKRLAKLIRKPRELTPRLEAGPPDEGPEAEPDSEDDAPVEQEPEEPDEGDSGKDAWQNEEPESETAEEDENDRDDEDDEHHPGRLARMVSAIRHKGSDEDAADEDDEDTDENPWQTEEPETETADDESGGDDQDHGDDESDDHPGRLARMVNAIRHKGSDEEE